MKVLQFRLTKIKTFEGNVPNRRGDTRAIQADLSYAVRALN